MELMNHQVTTLQLLHLLPHSLLNIKGEGKNIALTELSTTECVADVRVPKKD